MEYNYNIRFQRLNLRGAIKTMKIKYKRLLIILLIISILFAAAKIVNSLIEPSGYYYPNYEKVDITKILGKNEFSENDYKELFYQTGLGKTAVDEILNDKTSGKERILSFQEDFFKRDKVVCEPIGIVTNQEFISNEDNKPVHGFNLAPYKDGYVLITKATHSLGWRHGHAAIITDAEHGETLEAVILGSNTMFQDINKWRAYPSFIMLKIKGASPEKLSAIAKFARNNLYDIPYGLTVGLTSKKNPMPENISATQCSHLVWYPFMQNGYNIDSDGSWLVTPKDIANSDLFEVVQIYGVNPEEIWP